MRGGLVIENSGFTGLEFFNGFHEFLIHDGHAVFECVKRNKFAAFKGKKEIVFGSLHDEACSGFYGVIFPIVNENAFFAVMESVQAVSHDVETDRGFLHGEDFDEFFIF